VVGEISAALVLLLATVVVLRGVRRLQEVNPGFEPDPVFQARISIPPRYQSPDDISRFYDRLLERLAILPGVRKVGVISVAPLSGLLRTAPFTIEGDAQHERDLPSVNLRLISPDYLGAVGTRLVRGRSFSETDRSDTPPVALVSSGLAAGVLNHDALGRRLLIHDNSQGPRPVQIVGVVEDVRQTALDAPPALDVYLPLRQIHPQAVATFRAYQFWMISTRTPPTSLRSAFVTSLRAVDPDAAIADAGGMRDYIEAALGPRRFSLSLFASFSVTGVLLSVSGLYGLVAYAVSQRQREIGLRMAIGATEGDIRRMIFRHAALLGLAGTALGGCLTAAARPLVLSLAGEASIPMLPASMTAGLLLVLVILAAWPPARRASRIQPIVALRGE
jgi:predicted permease